MDFVRYWHAKLLDPTLHAGTIGGARNNKFSADGQLFVETMLYHEVNENPFRTTAGFARRMREIGIDVDRK